MGRDLSTGDGPSGTRKQFATDCGYGLSVPQSFGGNHPPGDESHMYTLWVIRTGSVVWGAVSAKSMTRDLGISVV